MNQSPLDQTLSALANPTRREILGLLSHGEVRVTELAEPFAMSLAGVSKHIRVLERASLVQRRRSGKEHLLSLNPEPLAEAAAWIEHHRTVWTDRLQALDTMLRYEECHLPPTGEP